MHPYCRNCFRNCPNPYSLFTEDGHCDDRIILEEDAIKADILIMTSAGAVDKDLM